MINPVKTTFERTLQSNGFRKQGGTWYFDCPETILVVNLQKSQYGPSYYINLAVFVKALGDDKVPKEHQCHLRTRIEDVAGDDLERALDLDDVSFADCQRESMIETAIGKHAIPFLKSCSTLDGIREQIVEGRLDGVLVQKRVRALLGL